MNSPTSRSLAKLRKEGWTVAVVERWNSYARCRQDLFGFIDLIAIKGDITLAVQSTSGANVSARITKIEGCQAASVWLESPMRKIVVHGWRKVGARGARKLWECREMPIERLHSPEGKRDLANPGQPAPENAHTQFRTGAGSFEL